MPGGRLYGLAPPDYFSQGLYPASGDKVPVSQHTHYAQSARGGHSMNNNSNNFTKGIGVGMVVGSAIGMTVAAISHRSSHQTRGKVGRALKTVGDIVENIGSAFNM